MSVAPPFEMSGIGAPLVLVRGVMPSPWHKRPAAASVVQEVKSELSPLATVCLKSREYNTLCNDSVSVILKSAFSVTKFNVLMLFCGPVNMFVEFNDRD